MNSVAQELEMGHNAKLEHQRVIADIIANSRSLYKKRQILLEPLPETDLDPGNSESKCPDIQFRNEKELAVPVIIEIAGSFGYKTDFIKVRKLVEETAYGIEEAFVFNYETRNWYKYSKLNGILEENRSFSDVLQLDLNEFVN